MFGPTGVKKELVHRRRYRPFVDVRKISTSKTRDKLVQYFSTNLSLKSHEGSNRKCNSHLGMGHRVCKHFYRGAMLPNNEVFDMECRIGEEVFETIYILRVYVLGGWLYNIFTILNILFTSVIPGRGKL